MKDPTFLTTSFGNAGVVDIKCCSRCRKDHINQPYFLFKLQPSEEGGEGYINCPNTLEPVYISVKDDSPQPLFSKEEVMELLEEAIEQTDRHMATVPHRSLSDSAMIYKINLTKKFKKLLGFVHKPPSSMPYFRQLESESWEHD